MKTEKRCMGMEARLANLLLEGESVPTAVREHAESCEGCMRELEELRATMNLLDGWEIPEPSPYFLTRMEARLREEREAEPAGWFERLRYRLTMGAQTPMRPLAAMAMTVVLLVAGGTYLGVTPWDQATAPDGHPAVVGDLQTMDTNAQLLDQLETISSANDSTD